MLRIIKTKLNQIISRVTECKKDIANLRYLFYFIGICAKSCSRVRYCLPCLKDSDTQKLVSVGGTDASEVVEGDQAELGGGIQPHPQKSSGTAAIFQDKNRGIFYLQLLPQLSDLLFRQVPKLHFVYQ